MTNNVHNFGTGQKKVRLIPKSETAKSDLTFAAGAVVEDQGQVLMCMAPKKPVDTLYLTNVPSIIYKRFNPENGWTMTESILPYTAIEVNGVSYSLEGVYELNSSNVSQDLTEYGQGYVFPRELAALLRISLAPVPYKFFWPAGIKIQSVFFRNKTQETLNVKLIPNPKLVDMLYLIEDDEVNPTLKRQADQTFEFTLDPHFEDDDWMEFEVQIDSYVSNWGANAGQTIVDSLYFECYPQEPDISMAVAEGDFLEIDWGDGSPIMRHDWAAMINSTGDGDAEYYFTERPYAVAGTYTVRARCSIPLEYLFIQNVKEVKSWGKYATFSIYGFGYNWSNNAIVFSKWEPKIPSSYGYVMFYDIEGPVNFDVSKYNARNTEISYTRYNGDPVKFDDLSPFKPDSYFVWGNQIANYPQQKVPDVDFIVLSFEHDELAGRDLSVLLEEGRFGSGTLVGPQFPTSVNPYLSYAHDVVAKKTVFVFDAAKFKAEKASTQQGILLYMYFGFASGVKSGRIKATIQGYNGTGVTIQGNTLVLGSSVKAHECQYNFQSKIDLSETGLPEKNMALAYDHYVNGLLPHPAGIEIGYWSSRFSVTRPTSSDYYQLTGIPGMKLDFITKCTEVPTTPIVSELTIPETGALKVVDPFFGGYGEPIENSGYFYYEASFFDRSNGLNGLVGGHVKNYERPFSSQVANIYGHFGVFSRTVQVMSFSNKIEAWIEKLDGTRISPVKPYAAAEYTPEATLALDTGLISNGEEMYLTTQNVSDFTGEIYSARKAIGKYVYLDSVDAIVFEYDISRANQGLFRYPADLVGVTVHSRVVTPGSTNAAQMYNRTVGSELELYFDQYRFKAGQDAQIQTIELYFVKDGMLFNDFTLTTLANVTNVIQLGHWAV